MSESSEGKSHEQYLWHSDGRFPDQIGSHIKKTLRYSYNVLKYFIEFIKGHFLFLY